MTRNAARRALLLAALAAISSAADQHTRAAKGRQREEAEPPPATDWEPPPPVFMLFAFSGGSEDVVYEALRSAFTGCTLMPHASFVILTDTKETHNTVSTGLLRACPNHVASCGVRTSAQVGEACAWLSPRSAVWAPWEKGSFHRTFHQAGLGAFAKIVADADGVAPRWVEQAIVVDTDTIFNKDFTPVWNAVAWKMHGDERVLLAAKRFPGHACFKNQRLNSGVMQLHLARMREARWAETVVSFAASLRRNKTEELAGVPKRTCGAQFVSGDVLCTGDQEFLSLTCLDNPGRCITSFTDMHNRELCSGKGLPPGSYIYHYNCLDPDVPVSCPEAHCKAMLASWDEIAASEKWRASKYNDARTYDSSGADVLRTEIRRRCPYAFGYAFGAGAVRVREPNPVVKTGR